MENLLTPAGGEIGSDEWLRQMDATTDSLNLDECFNEFSHAIYYAEHTLQLTHVAIAIHYYFSIFEKIENLAPKQQIFAENRLFGLLPDTWLSWMQTWEDWFVDGKRWASRYH